MTQEDLPRSLVTYRVNVWPNQADLVFQSNALTDTSHVFTDQIGTSGSSPSMLGPFAGRIVRTDAWESDDIGWLLRHDDDATSLIALRNGFATVHTASNDLARSRRITGDLIEQLRSFEHEETLTPVTFWCLDQHNRAPLAMRRRIETPAWAGIEHNYSDVVKDRMQQLVALKRCPKERMILWHGPTGTGKTYALRALAREWRSWCDVAFISDPEEFIGGSGRYSPSYLFFVCRDARPSLHGQRSVLVILEDSGELMSYDARNDVGQGLSRLLNLTDGMLGQGLNVMVLITTNEPLHTLHPAVTRPGRLLAEIEFGPLSVDTANGWLAETGSAVRVSRPTSLAELYVSREPVRYGG